MYQPTNKISHPSPTSPHPSITQLSPRLRLDWPSKPTKESSLQAGYQILRKKKQSRTTLTVPIDVLENVRSRSICFQTLEGGERKGQLNRIREGWTSPISLPPHWMEVTNRSHYRRDSLVERSLLSFRPTSFSPWPERLWHRISGLLFISEVKLSKTGLWSIFIQLGHDLKGVTFKSFYSGTLSLTSPRTSRSSIWKVCQL